MKRLIVFASGGKEPDDGGSGFQELVENSRAGILQADVDLSKAIDTRFVDAAVQ